MNRIVNRFTVPFILSERIDDLESSGGDESLPFHEFEFIVLVDLNWLFVTLEPSVDLVGEHVLHHVIFCVDRKILTQGLNTSCGFGEKILELLCEGIDRGEDLGRNLGDGRHHVLDGEGAKLFLREWS